MASGIIWTPEERVIQPATPAPFDRRFSLGVWVPGAYGMALNTGAQLSPSATPVVSQGLRAARFNGSSDYQVTAWSGTPSVFSWVVVFKAELAPTTETSEAVVHRDGSSLTWGHGSPSYRGVVTFNSSGTYPKVALLDTTPGVWHTVVCVADGTQIRVWQNGRYCGSDTASGAITAGTWNFGRDAGAINATNYWAGDIALCALSPLAITDGQKISRNPWQLFEADNDPVFYSLAAGGGTTVAVPAGAVTLTGYAPTVTAGGTASASVPAGAVTLTAYAPTVTTGGTASTSVPLGTVTLTGYAPTVTVGGSASIDVPLGTVALTGYAPTVTTGGQAQIDVPLGTVALAGYAPTVTTTEHAYIAVPTAAMTLAAYVPTVTTSGTPDTWTPVSASTGTWTPASAAGGTWTPQ